MKTLYLLRHGTALSAAAGGDRERPLAPKGKEDCRALGKIMAAKGYIPDYALCSPALRTVETLEAIGGKKHIKRIFYPDVLYNGVTGDLLAEIQKIPDDADQVLVLAHIPGIHALAGMLAGRGKPAMIRKLIEGYNAGTLSVLSCACERWAEIQPEENELTDLLDPLDYNAPAGPTRWT